jgi:hypothetical protein
MLDYIIFQAYAPTYRELHQIQENILIRQYDVSEVIKWFTFHPLFLYIFEFYYTHASNRKEYVKVHSTTICKTKCQVSAYEL